MPELPEVETTVRGLNRRVRGLVIKDVWTDYYSEFYLGKPNIRNKKFFRAFRRRVVGRKILGARRRAKNILLGLSGGETILVHMKMTGHLLFGEYTEKEVAKNEKLKTKTWEPKNKTGFLGDPYNRFIHAVFTLSNGKHLALSDLRKFAKITVIKTKEVRSDPSLQNLGPEPLDPKFTAEKLAEQLARRPTGKIKQVLMDQSIVAGIGNIYSDEILWQIGVHPLSAAGSIGMKKIAAMHKAMKKILRYSISIGGDSESDYRDIDGKKGNYQNKAAAYAREGEPCRKRNCRGVIRRIKIGGRSAHFCPVHQKIFQTRYN